MFKYSSRFWLYAPTALFLTLAIAAMIHGWLAVDAFEKKLAALKSHEAIPGVIVDWTSVQVGGFPFRLDANFQNLSIAGAGAHGPFSWRSEKFAMHGLSYGRRQNVYEAAGRQQVRWTGADARTHIASFLPGSMRASSISDREGLKRFDLDITGMAGADMAGNDFAFTRFQFHLRQGSSGLDLMLKADALAAANLQVYASLSQAGAWAPLLRGEMSWPQAGAGWRAKGGNARLSQLVGTPELSPLY